MKKSLRIAMVISRFNASITTQLVEGALKTAKQYHIPEKNIHKVWVPGAFEIPVTASALAKTKKWDAIVCLGCILKGQTPHNQYLAQAVSLGLMQAALEHSIPITFGVLTPNTYSQAQARSGRNSANKGSEAMAAAIEMAKLWDTDVKHAN